ncbi:HupE/UreJ family protein [Brevibacillus dissolubilis]|uniref:HupE/UreJ family protein n=1 Tax=Brevibacillus dissolubilis TaxID=1844116 RepID=UPI00111711FD|nr:HupE/UreJ family protein [Brevibacillus dissolubilis]
MFQTVETRMKGEFTILYRFAAFLLTMLFGVTIPFSHVHAHAYSVSYSTLKIDENIVELSYSIDTLSVIEGLGGDADQNGVLEQKELESIEEKLEEWVEDSVVIEYDNQQQAEEIKEIKVTRLQDKPFVTVVMTYAPPKAGQLLTMNDGIQPTSAGSNYADFVTIHYQGQVSQAVLQGDQREWSMLLTEQQEQQEQQPRPDPAQAQPSTGQNGQVAATSPWMSFFVLGTEHILTGYDHLLFLLALLIGRQSLKQYIWVITSFTIAHSITLTLAVLGWIDLPGWIVEPVIALSILYVAVENIFRREMNRRWALTFAFGLIHGLGFASILREMNLPTENLVASLLSFNLGIEAVQLLLVLILLPLLTWVQKQGNYRQIASIISIAVALMGGYWLIERLFF